MEAKDTVILLEQTDNQSLRIMMEKILLQQAEISFKAGMMKIIQWFDTYSFPSMSIIDARCYYRGLLRAQLKEWGIEER